MYELLLNLLFSHSNEHLSWSASITFSQRLQLWVTVCCVILYYKILMVMIMSSLAAGDIFASTQGERVRALLKYDAGVPCCFFASLDPAAGILHLSVPLCCFPLWHNYSSGE
jgi:hypothetical protein